MNSKIPCILPHRYQITVYQIQYSEETPQKDYGIWDVPVIIFLWTGRNNQSGSTNVQLFNIVARVDLFYTISIITNKSNGTRVYDIRIR